jgi:uncharacterized protein (DUF302 family)
MTMRRRRTLATHTPCGLTRQLPGPFDEAVSRVKEALREEGFGVFTEIDALEAELRAGLLLPCKVVVYEDGDSTTVAAFDPEAATRLANNLALEGVAREAKARLTRALERL